jgi:tetratricopeptide (TPR) repeat protein
LDEKLGGVVFTAGRYDEAIPILERAIGNYRKEKDIETAGRVTARLAVAHRRRGTTNDGIALVNPIIEQLTSGGPSSTLASLHVTLSELYLLVGRYREMLARATRGGEIAREVGDEGLLGEAEMRRGIALSLLGREVEGYTVLQGALPLVEEAGDLLTLSIILTSLGTSAQMLGRMNQMRRCRERSLVVAERIGNPSLLCSSLGGAAAALLILGEWEEARHLAERLAPLLKTVGRGSDAAIAWSYLGLLALWRETGTKHPAFCLNRSPYPRRRDSGLGGRTRNSAWQS